MVEGKAVVNEKCTFCGACVDVCPVSAITLEKDEKTGGVDASAYKNVWVFIEHEHGKVSSVSFELLGQGRILADDLGCQLCGMLLCDSEQAEGFIQETIAYGAEKVYVMESPLLKTYRTDPFACGAISPHPEVQTRDRPLWRDDSGPGFCRECRNDPRDRSDRRLHRPRY